MIRMPSIYNRMWHGVLLSCLACGLGVSCADDYFSENESVGRMTTLSIQLPKAGAGDDSQVSSARFIAFQAGGGGTSGVLQVNTHISTSTANVEIPIGKSNIYIIANSTEITGLESITDEASLKQQIATWEQAKKMPHIMVGSYHNVSIEKDGLKDSDGNIINAGKGMQRLASKLTVHLECESLGGADMVIDSVTVNNRAINIPLLSQTFSGNTFVPSKMDLKKDFTAGTTGNVTTYQPFDFYLSEYLVDAAHAGQSTCLYIHAHHEGSNEHLSYPVYIGDWFGKGHTYEEFKGNKAPAEVVGITGLSVTRNKHYTLTCKLKGEEQTGMRIKTEVKNWEVVDINGDVVAPYLILSSTDLLVNPLKAEGTSLHYESSVGKDNITVSITDNPDNRFTYTLTDNNIRFIHSNLNVTRLTTTVDGQPVLGKAIITAKDGNTQVSKTVTLGVFNPISRFYVRGAETTTDYNALSPSKTIDTQWALDWAGAMGYANPYQGATASVSGKNPNSTLMGDAISDTYSGCSSYWESALQDNYKGRGVWRLPSSDGGDDSEAARLAKLLHNLNVSVMDFDVTANTPIWSLEADAVRAKVVTPGGGVIQLTNQAKNTSRLVRCVRDLDSSTNSGSASYLNVSHNKYEIAPISYRSNMNTSSIYYESDAPVTISLLDKDNNDISDVKSVLPFIGFTAESDERLYGGSEPTIAFPNASTRFKKGYFCLHSSLQSSLDESKTTLGRLNNGIPPVTLRANRYSLQFKAGDIIKVVQIVVVNSLAKEDAGYLNYMDAVGISKVYSGYDYSLNSKYISRSATDINLSLPVSDKATGCAGYYEGTPDNLETGKGCWMISYLPRYLGMTVQSYFSNWQYQLGFLNAFDIGNLSKAYGDGANFQRSAPDGWSLAYYWSTLTVPVSTAYQIVTESVMGSNMSVAKTSSAYVRCERRLNADILSLSSQYIELSPANSAEVLYYTNVSLAPISNDDVMYVSGSQPTPFTVTHPVSGKLTISCNSSAAPGDEANLLLRTAGRTKRSVTYKIIKLKVK